MSFHILTEGQVIRDTYEVERFLGEGTFAEVYRVRHRFLGRQAMKVFKREGMPRSDIEEILGEAVILSRIGHLNIVRVFDANVLESSQGMRGFFTMENIAGGSLDRFWQSHGPRLIPVETTVDILKQVCRGLAVAHAEDPPIIHRDIKPQNILVGYEIDGLRARVSDFGLAKSVNPLTLLATAAGTLAFKPPEIFFDNKSDSCAGDVWALGVTLYLMLTDRLPFDVDPDLGWANTQAFASEPDLPSLLNTDVDESLEDIVYKCLRPEPSERYQNAKELLLAMESWQRPSQFQRHQPKKNPSSEPSKCVLGPHSDPDAEEGARLVRAAIQIARNDGRLFEAADLMEEAFNKSPSLRERYANTVSLWRRGISM